MGTAGATSISQYAAVAAYEGDQGPVAMMRDEYQVRRDLLCKRLSDLGFVFPVPEGAFYTFVPMKPKLTQKIIGKGSDEAPLLLIPGKYQGTQIHHGIVCGYGGRTGNPPAGYNVQQRCTDGVISVSGNEYAGIYVQDYPPFSK